MYVTQFCTCIMYKKMIMILTCEMLLYTRETTKTCDIYVIDPPCSGRPRVYREIMFETNIDQVQTEYRQDTDRIQSEYKQKKKTVHTVCFIITRLVFYENTPTTTYNTLYVPRLNCHNIYHIFDMIFHDFKYIFY